MIDLRTLGPAAARRDGEPLDRLLTHPQSFALLVYLCVEGPTPRRRLTRLWNESESERGEALDRALRHIRRAVGEGVVIAEGGRLRCSGETVRCDAARLEDAAADGDWIAADRLYRGAFLADVTLPHDGWAGWKNASAAHFERLGRRAASELHAAGERSASSPIGAGFWAGGFLGKLRTRKVVQVAAIYVAAAWAGLQAVDTLIQRGLLPEWVFASGLGLGAVGLAVVVAIAWLQESEAVGGAEDDARGPRWFPRATSARLLVGLGAAAVMLLGAVLILQRILPDAPGAGEGPGSESAALRSIAVLYFDDHSPDQNLEPIAAGFTDALIHHLAQVPALDIPSRNAVKRYRDGELSLDSLIADLDVGAYVEGAVTGTGDTLRVTAQLIDASTGRHVESTSLSASMDDVLNLRDELADEIARILRRRLGREIRLRERQADAQDQEAWVLVQRAEALRDAARDLARTDRDAASEALEAADSLLDRAGSRDPEWVIPVIHQGWTAARRALLETELPGSYDPAWARTALEYAERAVSISDGHPEALELRGRVRFELAEVEGGARADSLYGAARSDLERAVGADSTLARAWVTLSDLYQRRAQTAQAKRAAEQALRADYYLDEARAITFRLWNTTLELDQEEEASRWCGEGRRRWPDDARFLQCRIYNLASYADGPGDVAAAWAALDSMLARTAPTQKEVMRRHGLVWVAQVAAGVGLADSAAAVIRRARGPEPDPALAYNEAHARLRMGQEQLALELLELHVRHFPSRGGDYLAGDWWFRDLRGNPRFRRLVEEGPPLEPSAG